MEVLGVGFLMVGLDVGLRVGYAVGLFSLEAVLDML